MSTLAPSSEGPHGLSWSSFKALCADSGQWLWGTVQGAFNEKASFTQIIVDALVGMIPLLGDATAVRDLIAITIGLIDDPKKRESVWEWVLLVVMLFALIPVLGGVVKGAGRIVVTGFKEASKLSGAARAAHLTEGAKDLVAFLNRIGAGNAERWLTNLHISSYQAQVSEKFNDVMDTMNGALVQIRRRTGNLMPAGLGQRIDGLRNGIAQLKAKAGEMIPKAIKELDQDLRELQAYVRTGGETTSRKTLYEVATGERVVTRTDEARLVEDGALPMRSARGGFIKNTADANKPNTWQKYYRPEPGYPDLSKTPDGDGQLREVAAFSGRMVNRELKQGEEVYRFFGPGGVTHELQVGESYPGGAWWGLGKPPETAQAWREPTAVLDEWNRDGYMVVGRVTDTQGPKAVVGTISEQSGQKIPGQYLPGGSTQAVFTLSDTAKAQLEAMGQKVVAGSKTEHWFDPSSGITYEIRPTGWKDANGIWGYWHMPGQGTVQTVRLSAREIASKHNEEVTIDP